MRNDLKLAVGDDALRYLQAKAFQVNWERLYDRCPWATVYQSHQFVLPWYEIYQDQYCPVIVFAEGENGDLAGLLTLAFRQNAGKLTGAGDAQAEYQCWLADPNKRNAFIDRALSEISEKLPRMNLSLRYLPPDTPVDWIGHHRRFNGFCCLRSHMRPLMEIDGPAMDRQRRKKNNRQNYNRLKKIGEVEFEHVTDHARFIDIIDEISIQHDLRHGAIHDVTPFLDDPLKKAFQIELHKRGILHTTVLKVGGKLAASHAGLISKEAVHLCITTHSHALSAHSPGALHLAMLGVRLAEQGVPVFDLTPGGDRYKESFATAYDTVYEINFYPSLRARFVSEAFISARQFIKATMYRAGLTPKEAHLIFGWLFKKRQLGFRDAAEKMAGAVSKSVRIYRLSSMRPGTESGPMAVARNLASDLLRFDPAGSAITRQEFLATALDRFERGIDTYTYVEGGILMFCCGVVRLTGTAQTDADRYGVGLPDNSALLVDLYVHKKIRDKALVLGFIEGVIADVKHEATAENIYLVGDLDRNVKAIVERCGFVKQGRSHFPALLRQPASNTC